MSKNFGMRNSTVAVREHWKVLVGNRKNIFVVGLDNFNYSHNLAPLARKEGVRFLPLLRRDEVKGGREFRVAENLKAAEARLDAYHGSIDGIIGHWDFPVSLMVPILCHRRGLPAPPLDAVFKCEHKYWSRLLQSQVTAACPAFRKVDPFGDVASQIAGLPRPLWIKPVKAYLGQLAFRIENDQDVQHATRMLRRGIERFARPFDLLLREIDLPPELTGIGGKYCIAEEQVSGAQVTLEGYAYDGRVETYGAADTISYPDSPTLHHLEYPSLLPEPVQQRMSEITARVMSHIGYSDGPFNIEFFWDKESSRLSILEINPRISQSHAVQFRMVDGVSHHRVALDLALGRAPKMLHRQGRYNCAAKFMLRHFNDGLVRHAPHPEDCERVQRSFPDTLVKPYAPEGTRLSDTLDQDSYSFLLAEVFLGAANHDELMERWQICRGMLNYDIESIPFSQPERAGAGAGT